MVRIAHRRLMKERGQAIVLVILALSIFLFGAMGLAIDGAQLYAQRQMAQSAADAAAQAGIVSIFDGLTSIGTAAYYCTSANTTSPCNYAGKNGFTAGSSACTSPSDATVGADCVKVDPNPGVTVTGLDPGSPNELQVTITRAVPMTLMKMIGLNSFNVTATATAAIVDVQSPVPILITHPTMANSLSMNGTTGIKICGGPQRSIQVNSSASNAYNSSQGHIDLRYGGPSDTAGNCMGTAGSDFGVYGGATTDGGAVLVVAPTTKHYLSPSDWIDDPLKNVSAPGVPGTPGSGSSGSGCTHCGNCPNGVSCKEYIPGLYTTGINTTGNDAIFDPGVYYLQSGGFIVKNGAVGMCTSCSADATTKNGVVFYDTGAASGGCKVTGGFTVDTNSTGTLYGAGINSSSLTSAPAAPYYGILYFEDHNSCAHTGSMKATAGGAHSLGQGNSCVLQYGTTYITNTRPGMLTTPARYQEVDMNGGTCTGVNVYGEIIVSNLSIVGNSTITMTLSPLSFVTVRQIALVNGE